MHLPASRPERPTAPKSDPDKREETRARLNQVTARKIVGELRPLFLLFITSLVAAAAGCGSEGNRPAAENTSPTSTASTDVSVSIDDRFAVSAGYELALRCLGEESPVIILESGSDGSGLEEYAGLIHPLAAASRTKTCTYDRPGAGQSDPPSKRRRTLDDAVADLHDLVEAADLAPPFVLVGSSAGGGIAVYYAGRYPEQVAGVVMLDVPAPTGDLGKEFPGAMGWRNPEHLDYVDGDRRLFRNPPDLGDVPVRIVTATDGQSSAKDQSFWLDLSSRAEQTTIQGGHDLTSENPAGVIAEIQEALDTVQK